MKNNYFHPDHLGSSNVITEGSGYAYQLFLNLPFGETMAEQRRTGTFSNVFKFNGKELDTETGLYYYGARYYNPRTSVWLSVDPIALWQPVQEIEHYILGQHNGGYFNPKNMSVYGYTYQNPIVYIDPNGKQNVSPYINGLFGQLDYEMERFVNKVGNFFTSKETYHTTLDVAGLVPVYGEAFDAINAAWYALEGDYYNAGLSAAAIIPIAGYGAVGIKWLSKGFKMTDETSKLIKWAGKAEGGKEIVMKTYSNTFSDAKKVVDDIVDLGGDAISKEGKFGYQKGQVVGKQSPDGKRGWRLDWDSEKGAHINWWSGNKKGAVLTGQSENQVRQAITNETLK